MQIKAIQLAVTNCFQLIQGPPGYIIYACIILLNTLARAGSGKSVIGTHIAYIFAQVLKDNDSDQCVVYCAPSNKAVDVVHGQL